MGWFATNALRESRLLRRFLNLPTYLAGSDGGIDGIVDAAGNTIDFGTPVYTYGYEPNPADVPKYTEILIDPSCLTGSGATPLGIKRQSDNKVWRFADAGQILYSKSGTVATPLVSGVTPAAASAETSMWGSLNPIMIPAYMLYEGFRGRLKATFIKTGATATWDVFARIGRQAPGGSVTNNDQLFYTPAPITSTSGRHFQLDVEFVITSAGVSVSSSAIGDTTCAITTKSWLPTNSTGGASAVMDKGLYMSTVDAVYVNLNIKGTSGDTFALLDYTFIAMPI